MTRDYKHRVQSRRTRKAPVPWWKWLLIVVLIAGFVAFLISLGDDEPDGTSTIVKPLPKAKSTAPDKSMTQAKTTEQGPRFDFYTILPEKEVVVSDYEIKTRKRAETVGKAKATRYILQAGSFRNYQEADRLKARLALMGIESKIEKARVGEVNWNRIKIGPFAKMSSVDRIRKRLRENNIDVVVTEIQG